MTSRSLFCLSSFDLKIQFMKLSSISWPYAFIGKGMMLMAALLFYCKAPAQIITTIAGNGANIDSGDGAPATASSIIRPLGLIFDGSGMLYWGEDSRRVRAINTSGIINTIAGSSVYGYSGDGGPATAAGLRNPYDLCLDGIGNMYIADYSNHCVRKIDAFGIITTFAGTGIAGYSGDGGPATIALLNHPVGITADTHGNIYIAELDNNVIRKITPSGIISTIAGTGIAGYSGDGGPATIATLNQPIGLRLDAIGNLYFVDCSNNTVRKIGLSGIVTTIAGTGTAGYSGDNGPATAAQLYRPYYITFDHNNNIYFSDRSNNCIRKINAAGIITTMAGTGTAGFSGDGAPSTAAQLNFPTGVATDCSDNLYISDGFNYRVRKIQFNRPPLFTSGHTQYFHVCADTLNAPINALLAAIDTDLGQTITWSVAGVPAHGALSGAYTATSTGAALTPVGLSYTPATGYTGNDTFKISVNDCDKFPDTMTVYVQVLNCSLGAANVSSTACNAVVWPNPCDGAFSISVSSAADMQAGVTITDMLGKVIKTATVPTNKETNLKLDAPAGVYLLNITTASGNWVKKLVVNRLP
jgi:hypothetical protein